MLVSVTIEENTFDLVIPTGDMVLLNPRIAHCHLCGHVWPPEGLREPKHCASCKATNYMKFPDEFDYDSCPCSICKLEWDFHIAIFGSPLRTTLKRVDPWTPHETPKDALANLLGDLKPTR